MVKFKAFGREYLLFESLKALTADKTRGPFGRDKRVFKPKNIATYYDYYKNYDLIRAPIDDLTEGAVGQGYYTTVEKVTPVHKKSASKELVDEFSAHFNLDSMLPNITRNMLIAGFCPVETLIKRGPVEKNALKIIHPMTVKYIDEKNGKVNYIIQKVNDKEVRIEGKNLAWFVYTQIANDVRGTSLIMSLYNSLNTLIDATDDLDAILDRYISPLGIWKSRRSIDAIKEAATNRDDGEDIFLGELTEEEMKDGVVEFITIDPRIPFWDYIIYLDRRVYAGARANNIWYLRNASEASAKVVTEVVDRHVHAIQRNVKRAVEGFWFKKLIEVNNLPEVPKINFGAEPTGVEDIQAGQFLTVGVEIGYLSQGQYFDILNQLGIKVKPEDNTVPGSSVPAEEEEPEVEPVD